MWKSLLASIVFLLSTTSVLYAGPALNNFFEIRQPDGASFKARKHGDEFQNWTETENGYTVIKNKKTKEWEYAAQNPDGTLRGSGQKVIPSQQTPANIPKKLKPLRKTEAEKSLAQSLQTIYQQRMPSTSPPSPKSSSKSTASTPSDPGGWTPTPVSGNRNIIMILVNFTDRTLITTAETWAASVFNTTPGVKSIANYYKDNSFNLLSVSPVTHTQPGNPPGVVTVSIAYPHP